jgi:hypothetical protein
MSIQTLRSHRSPSAALQRMIDGDLAAFDASGDVALFGKRATRLRQSIAAERYPNDCAWAGVEMADVATLYELAADDLARIERVAA